MSRPAGSKNKATLQREFVEAKGDFLTSGNHTIPTGPVWTPPVDLNTGLSRDDEQAMEQARLMAEAEKKIDAEAIPESNKNLILQEIKVDTFNTIRRYVELTPSMCDVRNCGYDAAKEMNCAGWNAAPVNQMIPDGKGGLVAYGQRLIEMKEYHKATSHTTFDRNDHIISQEDLAKRQWSIGGARTDFLTAAK